MSRYEPSRAPSKELWFFPLKRGTTNIKQEGQIMSKRGENIYKRKDGRWEARYVKGYTISGKIIYGFCYGKSYREAKFKAFEKKAELFNERSFAGECNHFFFEFFCNEWLCEQWGTVKDSSYAKYENVLKKHILPNLGMKKLDAITAEQVERLKWELIEEKGLSPKTVKDVLSEIHMILKYAARQYPGALREIKIKYPKDYHGEIRVLSVKEQQLLITYLKTDMDACKFGTLLALLTGMRIGELCALRWENISMVNRTIRIDSTMQRLKNFDETSGEKTRVVMGHPKSDTSARIIPMSDSIFALCAAHPSMPPDAFVLTATQQYMEPRKLQRRMEKYTSDCGLEGVHFHTLRHTFATRCIEAGVDLKSLSEILGHANTTITLKRYVHSSLEQKRQNMNKLSNVGL